MNLQRMLKWAIDTSEGSLHHQHRVGCVIFYKGKPLSFGTNDPLTWRKKIHPRFKQWPHSIHAEVMAISKMRMNGISLRDCVMVIARTSRSGLVGLAKPCEHCLAYIKYVGLRKVYYTTGQYRLHANRDMEPIVEKLEL